MSQAGCRRAAVAAVAATCLCGLVSLGLAGPASAAGSGPTVTGGDPPQIGAQLTATPIFGSDEIDWVTCDSSGAQVGTGDLATATTTYTLSLGDQGTYVCAVEQSIFGSLSSAPVGPVEGLRAGPTLSAASGQAVAQGQTLTVSPGDWGPGVDVTDAWLDCNASGTACQPVAARATGPSYTVGRADAGHRIAVLETATATRDGTRATATTPATGAVVATAPVNTSPPTVSGTPAVGHTLTASPGSWSNDPTAYAYAWARCSAGACTAIAGATSQTYAVGTADVGDALEVRVTASVLSTSGSAYPSFPTTVVTGTAAPSPSGHHRTSTRKPGRLAATMRWTFRYGPSFTTVLALDVVGPSVGSTITVRCGGHGCPYRVRRRTIVRPRRCGSGRTHGCSPPRIVGLQSSFRHRRLGVGAALTVTITRQRSIGRYYRFAVRTRKPPRVTISCLAPNSIRPGKGCARS